MISSIEMVCIYFYPHMLIGKVWINRLVFFFVMCVCVCLFVFVRLQISLERIKLAASNFSR